MKNIGETGFRLVKADDPEVHGLMRVASQEKGSFYLEKVINDILVRLEALEEGRKP